MNTLPPEIAALFAQLRQVNEDALKVMHEAVARIQMLEADLRIAHRRVAELEQQLATERMHKSGLHQQRGVGLA